jgi:signal transduction histidine kinase
VSDDDRRNVVAGRVAIEIARQLADPVRALRDRLGLVVDQLERHVATATGPNPYPWRSVQALRQDLGGAYLEATALARRVDELDRALDGDAIGWFDLPAAVDLGLRLASHHLTGGPASGGAATPREGPELMIDLGDVPPARGTPGMLALVVAHLAAACAGSARARPGSTLSVRVGSDGPWAFVLLADNGAGIDRGDRGDRIDQLGELGELAREILTPWGATVEAASAEGQGCAFELRLMTMV